MFSVKDTIVSLDRETIDRCFTEPNRFRTGLSNSHRLNPPDFRLTDCVNNSVFSVHLRVDEGTSEKSQNTDPNFCLSY